MSNFAFDPGVGGSVDITELEVPMVIGDILLGDGTSNPSLLNIGANTQVLTVAGGTAVWAANGGQWTDTGSILHPSEETIDNVIVGGTTLAGADIILGVDGSSVFNEQGADADFRVEGDTEVNLIFADASTDRVGIGTATPDTLFHVAGAAHIAGKLTVDGLIDPTGLILDEQASAPAGDVAGKGQLFVKNDAPNVLIFRDDAGGETALGAAPEWTDTGTILHPTEIGDDVVIGGTAIGFSDIELRANGGARFNQQNSATGDFLIGDDTRDDFFVVAASFNRIGIGGSPGAAGGRLNIFADGSVGTDSTMFGTIVDSFDKDTASFVSHFGALCIRNLDTTDGNFASIIFKTGNNTGGMLGAKYVDRALSSMEIFVATHNGTDLGIRTSWDKDGNLFHGGGTATGITAANAKIALNTDGSAVFNEQGEDVDFRVEGDTQVNLIFGDASTDRVGIGTAAPDTLLHIAGAAHVDTTLTVDGVVTDPTGVIFAEQASAPAGDVAGKGQLFVKDDTPNVLIFRDDAGTEVTLGLAGEWTDTGSVLHPSEETVDNVVIGGTTAAGADIALNVDGSAVFNEQGAAVDFRVEGDTEINLLFVDGSADSVGIGTATPSSTLDVQGSLTLKSRTIIANATVAANDFRIFGDTTIPAADITATLPAASASTVGRIYRFFRIAGAANNDLVVAPNGTNLINGVNSSKSITSNFTGMQIEGLTATSWLAVDLSAA